MNINEMRDTAYNIAEASGWHDKTHGEVSAIERLCLIHSEVSETVEAIRLGQSLTENFYPDMDCDNPTYECGDIRCQDCEFGIKHKPCGVPSELADIVIRIGDMCGVYGIDLEAAIIEKMEYNKTRSYRHGGKVI